MSIINLNDSTPAAPVGNSNITWQKSGDNVSGYVPNATVPLTTKGDVLGYDTVPDRIPVGSDGQVLTAASGQPLGVQWQTPLAGGGVPISGWSAINGIIYDDYLTPQLLSFYPPTNSSLNWRFVKQATFPGVPYTFIATVRFTQNNDLNNSACAIGVYLTDGTQLIGFEVFLGANTAPQLRVERMHSVTSDDITVAGPTANLIPPSVFTMKIVNDGTHRTFYYYTGGAWTQFYQEATGAWLTETAVGVGGISYFSNAAVYVAGELIAWSLS